MSTLTIILYGLLGGVLPALIWLVFWLEEDKAHPEPRKLILLTFIFGMAATIFVLPFEKLVGDIWPTMGLIPFILWAALEEGFKFLAAYFAALRRSDDNEPIDPIIYMIIAALGFVALENTLFIINPLFQSDIVGSILTGNLRFIGASLLHIVSSATIGITLAFTFYKPVRTRRLALIFGFLLAVAFHAAFNLFIIQNSNTATLITFGMVWIGVTVLFWMFERAKGITPQTV